MSYSYKYKEAIKDFKDQYQDMIEHYRKEGLRLAKKDIELGVWPDDDLKDGEYAEDFKDFWGEKIPTLSEVTYQMEDFRKRYPGRKATVYIWTRVRILYKEGRYWEEEPTDDEVHVDIWSF